MQFGLADTGCSGVAFFLQVKVCDQSACFTRGSLEAWGKILVCRVVNGRVQQDTVEIDRSNSLDLIKLLRDTVETSHDQFVGSLVPSYQVLPAACGRTQAATGKKN